jgi:hypothetical protein
MPRWWRWLALALIALVVIGVVVAVVTVRPGLSDARDRVDQAWSPLRPALVNRYQNLGGVELALATAGGQARTVTKDLSVALTQWQHSARVDDPATQAPLANDLEALALRVKANVNASDRLRANPGLVAALGAFDRAIVSPPAIAAYNAAAHDYEQQRSGAVHHLVASLFGFDARPTLAIAGA